MSSEWVKFLSVGIFHAGVSAAGIRYRRMDMYASSDDGSGRAPWDIDIKYSIEEDSEDGLIVWEQRCGRDRGSFWTEPEESHFSRLGAGFYEVAQEIINEHGRNRVWYDRIGHAERW